MRKRITPALEWADRTPADRLACMRAALAEERRAAADRSLDSWDIRVAEKNVADLETAIERTTESERLHAERIAALETDQREREAQAAADLESRLRAEYTAAAPGPVSDADWQAVRGDVLHRHRLAEIERREATVQAAAQRYRQLI